MCTITIYFQKIDFFLTVGQNNFGNKIPFVLHKATKILSNLHLSFDIINY